MKLSDWWYWWWNVRGKTPKVPPLPKREPDALAQWASQIEERESLGEEETDGWWQRYYD